MNEWNERKRNQASERYGWWQRERLWWQREGLKGPPLILDFLSSDINKVRQIHVIKMLNENGHANLPEKSKSSPMEARNPPIQLESQVRGTFCGEATRTRPKLEDSKRRFSLGSTLPSMVHFNRTQSFDGMCAPFIYIEGCSKDARLAFMNAARVWLPVNSIVLIALISAFIYRYKRVSEPFNTLRLAMICFTAGLPLYDTHK